jgi:hypothetical protein
MFTFRWSSSARCEAEPGGQKDRPPPRPLRPNIGPHGEITALAVGYGHLVPEDTIFVERRVETHRGMLRYEFPVAGLASWLSLKADAIMLRDKPKDAYDVVWLTSALGPDQAARLAAASPLLSGELAADVLRQLGRLVNDQFSGISAVGPAMYADFLETESDDAARRYAHGSIVALGQALRGQGIQLGQQAQ